MFCTGEVHHKACRYRCGFIQRKFDTGRCIVGKTSKVGRGKCRSQVFSIGQCFTNGCRNISWIDQFPDALVLEERQNIFQVPSFKEGLFEVQDAASQHIAPFLKIEPGQRVIDACAGAGGKTLHLAALMKNKGRIIAMDVEQWKLDELTKRARRAGVSNLEPRLIDSSKVIKRLENSADRSVTLPII